MVYKETIKGKYVELNPVLPDNAEFVIKIRNDKTKNQFLHETPPDIKYQIEWIVNQNKRPGDYYFVVQKGNQKIGLASLYDICEDAHTVEFGRWISEGNALDNVETVILLFDLAFSSLKINEIQMFTMLENKRIRNFWRSFGASIGEVIDRKGIIVEKEYIKKDDYYNHIRSKNTRLLRY